ncbi:hypothetical protein HMPREF2674_01775 [Rothia sp. HMSC062F03]|nr:hypothetical protein HMPREF2674_01775 [Rothia sp. HMSC062F03]
MRGAPGVLRGGRVSFPLKKILNAQELREKGLGLTERVEGLVHTALGLDALGFFIKIKTKYVI